MMDYIGSGLIVIFIILVLVWIKRRETREKLAAEAQPAQVASQSKPDPDSWDRPASASQPTADGQHHDDQHG